jgi:hypothetical protein
MIRKRLGGFSLALEVLWGQLRLHPVLPALRLPHQAQHQHLSQRLEEVRSQLLLHNHLHPSQLPLLIDPQRSRVHSHSWAPHLRMRGTPLRHLHWRRGLLGLLPSLRHLHWRRGLLDLLPFLRKHLLRLFSQHQHH